MSTYRYNVFGKTNKLRTNVNTNKIKWENYITKKNNIHPFIRINALQLQLDNIQIYSNYIYKKELLKETPRTKTLSRVNNS